MMAQWRDMVKRFIIAHEEKQSQQNRKEEHWKLHDGDDLSQKRDSDDDVDQTNQQPLQLMITLLQQLKSLATQSIPQLLSRILYAIPTNLHEISLGYFVPFHTVAIACLARIHSLLMKMGRDLVTLLRETVPQLRNILTNQSSFFGTSGKGIVDNTKSFRNLILESIVVDERYEAKLKKIKKKPSNPNSGMPPLSNEWNNLMEHFIDANQDEITLQMNKYVKDRRWEFAMRKLGFVNSVSTMLLSEQQIESENDISSECDDLTAYHDKVQIQSKREEKESPDISCSDMGELVNVQPGHNDIVTQNNVLLIDVLDQNMARVMEGKVNLASKSIKLASKPTAESSKLSESKKKRAKVKKKKANHEMTSFANSTISPVVAANRLQPHQHINSTNRPINIDTTAVDGPEPVENNIETSTKAMAGIDVTTNDCETSNSKKGKKKKKKRKSTSVIDDIFGF